MSKRTKFIQIGLVVALIALNAIAYFGMDVRWNDSYLGSIKAAFASKEIKPAAKRTSKIYELKKADLDQLDESEDLGIMCPPVIRNEESVLTGELIDIKLPKNLPENEYINLSMTVKNTGDVMWYGDSHECVDYPKMRLGNMEEPGAPHPLWNDFSFLNNNWIHNEFKNRISMREATVAPGEIATFSVWVKTPETVVTREVEVVENEETGEEEKKVTLHKWIYERFTFTPVEGETWLDTQIPVTMKLGDVPMKESEKIKFLNAKLGTYSLSDYPGEKNVYITLKDQKAALRYGEKPFYSYVISSGAWDTPTPTGDHRVYNKQELRVGGKAPHYRMPYWIGLRINGGPFEGFGLHEVPYLGVSRETSAFYQNGLYYDLGKNVSHGCVRSAPEDAEFLYQFSELDMPILVRRGLDEELVDPDSVVGRVNRSQSN